MCCLNNNNVNNNISNFFHNLFDLNLRNIFKASYLIIIFIQTTFKAFSCIVDSMRWLKHFGCVMAHEIIALHEYCILRRNIGRIWFHKTEKITFYSTFLHRGTFWGKEKIRKEICVKLNLNMFLKVKLYCIAYFYKLYSISSL